MIRNEPERGQVICRTPARPETIVKYPDARLTLFIECLVAMTVCCGDNALKFLVGHIAQMQPGRVMLYGHGDKDHKLTAASTTLPKVVFALQHLPRRTFRINAVVAARIGRSIKRLPTYRGADGCTLIHWTSDNFPDFHMHECNTTAIDMPRRMNTNKNNFRVIQFITKSNSDVSFDDPAEIARELSNHLMTAKTCSPETDQMTMGTEEKKQSMETCLNMKKI